MMDSTGKVSSYGYTYTARSKLETETLHTGNVITYTYDLRGNWNSRAEDNRRNDRYHGDQFKDEVK
ncbi:hypothetical protein O9H85_23235 [Paenibacillus filicis]|uniref:Uncharacterized protein n=1 Tax=Paenibacillus gyeongsangnamensis TaxID=3388067 RepID=A0ABT4QEH4_9BACL|nr:hypothetical protein [Paenibacillus filicis]